MKLSKRLMIFAILFLVSLLVVFFITKTKNYNTWKTSINLSLDGYKSFKKWIDLVGWVVLTYKIDFSDYENTYANPSELAQAKNWVKKIIDQEIDRRINSLWVSDYSSNFKLMNNAEYLEVQIWWISDIEYAKQLIGKTVKLDFKLPYQWNDEKVKNNRLLSAQQALKDVIASWDTIAYYNNPDENSYYIKETYTKTTLTGVIKSNFDKLLAFWTGKYYPTLLSWEIGGIKGWAIVKYEWIQTGGVSTWTNYGFEYLFIWETPRWVLAIDPKSKNILNGSYFLQALVEQTQTWRPSVRIDFNSQWKEIWCNITTQNVGKQLAIFVGDQKISDPTIQEPICGWSTQVTFWSANFDEARTQAKQLVQQLNYTLPVPLILSNEEKVSPLLWETALRWAIIAWLVWFALVFVFMVYMYGIRLGLLSMTWILVFLTILFAVVKILDVALSLSGIAAIILNIWMAVDANILIYERLKEEFLKWKAEVPAINDAYDRSFLAIRDWNLTTWFIGVLLFMIWVNVFKWFGTMMLLNIVLTLFVVVPLAKELLIYFRTNK